MMSNFWGPVHLETAFMATGDIRNHIVLTNLHTAFLKKCMQNV